MLFNYGITQPENLLPIWNQTFIKVNYIVENLSTTFSLYAEDQITIILELLIFEQTLWVENDLL